MRFQVTDDNFGAFLGDFAGGGAIFTQFAGAALVVSDSTFSHNQAVGGDRGAGGIGGSGFGGGIRNGAGSTATITDCAFGIII